MPATTTRRLLVDSAVGGSDPFQDIRVGVLAPNATHTVTVPVTIPAGTPAGTHSLIAVADVGEP